MTTLKDYLEAISYKVVGGSEYQWGCFGDNARYLDCHDKEGYGGDYSIHAIFDSIDQTVYAIELWDYKNDREYRWIDPMFVGAHMKACTKHEVDCYESMDGRNYIDLDLASDILEKISKVVAGEQYDTRVQIPVDFSDEDLLQYMKLAHEMDITFNELVERAVKEAIDDFNSNPKEFKKKAKRFINENYGGVGSPS